MNRHNLCLVGFGNVGKMLVTLLLEKRDWLRERHGIEWAITGVATRRMGRIFDPEGLDPEALLRGELSPRAETTDVRAWLKAANCGVLFEASSLDVETGEPAMDHLRAALEHGAHAISANKGPLVHGYAELSQLAKERGRRFLSEAAFMGGVPVFSLFRECLPLVRVRRFAAIANSTTSVILQAIEAGKSLQEGVKLAQSLGMTETDPSHDIDGWDAAVKVVAFANVVMGAGISLADVAREGIRGLDPTVVRASLARGRTWRLVARGEKRAGGFVATVRPEELVQTDPLAADGSTLYLEVETDMHPGLTVACRNADVRGTAYDMLADFVFAAGTRLA